MEKIGINKSGFTLVEIMIAILIIGLLSGIAIPNILVAKVGAAKNSCLANIKQLNQALEMAATLDNAATGSLDQAEIAALAVPGYIKKMPDCAYGDYSTDADGNVKCSYATHQL